MPLFDSTIQISKLLDCQSWVCGFYPMPPKERQTTWRCKGDGERCREMGVHAHVRMMRMYKAATIATGTYLVEARAMPNAEGQRVAKDRMCRSMPLL